MLAVLLMVAGPGVATAGSSTPEEQRSACDAIQVSDPFSYVRGPVAPGWDATLDTDGDGLMCEEVYDPARPDTPMVAGDGSGYLMLDEDGRVYRFGDADFWGDKFMIPEDPLFDDIPAAVDLSVTPGGGYVITSVDGHTAGFGAPAPDVGGSELFVDGERAIAVETTPNGEGYWIFTSIGRVITEGFEGQVPEHHGDLVELGLSDQLNGPIVDAIATPGGEGYYMVGTDGGIFSFGDAQFAGSVPEVLPGVTLNSPVNGLVPDPDGFGYWLVAGDGGVFAFEAGFVGSIPGVLPAGVGLNEPIIGMVSYGNGYLMVASDGGIFNFATDLDFVGSLGDVSAPTPIVAIAPSAGSAED